ncbi:MAG: glutamine-hydrolyzing carbamoyl-phosphate synthase small subunit [Endomicrobia bacterium]|nr:glutamine-hydrolyzing carbamoyl-phosphate synthase small subunit [Endomicrobiia bacterium]
MTDGILMLETGMFFTGKIFGYIGETAGEIIFNTGIVGYEEVLTDPSYKGQIVVMTYPHIGNYGITLYDFESVVPQVEGFVVHEFSQIYSNWQAKHSIEQLFKKYKIVGIEGIDTRALTKYIRTKGSMRALISPEVNNVKKLYEKVKKVPSIIGQDLVKKVTTKNIYQPFSMEFNKQQTLPVYALTNNVFISVNRQPPSYKVVVIDCGCKFNILRLLRKYGCDLIVVPADTSFDKILSYNPDGIFLSNGPGDPEGVPYVFKTVEKIISYSISTNTYLPIFGICFGHQMIALAAGGKTYKLKFGHHGINHPVKNLSTLQVEITSQNHNFAVEMEEIQGKLYIKGNRDLEVTHLNLNDYSCEGIKHKNLPIFAVQYHPESAPGPNDSKYLFEEFINLMKKKDQLI